MKLPQDLGVKRFPAEVRHLVDGSAWVPRKGVASCDKPGLGACSRRPPDT